jgi:hypothetical protein
MTWASSSLYNAVVVLYRTGKSYIGERQNCVGERLSREGERLPYTGEGSECIKILSKSLGQSPTEVFRGSNASGKGFFVQIDGLAI